MESSILELFGNNGAYDDVTEREIYNLTQQTLLDKINGVNKSGIFLGPKSFSSFLGDISYDQVSWLGTHSWNHIYRLIVHVTYDITLGYIDSQR